MRLDVALATTSGAGGLAASVASAVAAEIVVCETTTRLRELRRSPVFEPAAPAVSRAEFEAHDRSRRRRRVPLSKLGDFEAGPLEHPLGACVCRVARYPATALMDGVRLEG